MSATQPHLPFPPHPTAGAYAVDVRSRRDRGVPPGDLGGLTLRRVPGALAAALAACVAGRSVLAAIDPGSAAPRHTAR